MKIHEMNLQECRDEQARIRQETSKFIVSTVTKLKKERDAKIEMLDQRIHTINRVGIKKRMNEIMLKKKRSQ